MMEPLLALLSIAGAITLGAMSPGPSFVLVARTSVARSRADGLAMAVAMGVGGVAYSVLALAGVHVVLLAAPFLYGVLKVAGGAYLVYLAWGLWRNAATPISLETTGQTSARSFGLGLLTWFSNPKAAFCIEAGWYAIVALALSAPAPAAAYLRWKRWIDRTAGGVMGLLGIKLVLTRPEA